MGCSVTGVEPEQALISHMRADGGTWQSLASGDPLPEKYLSSSWVWILEEIDEQTTRLIVRVRSDNSPGPLTMFDLARRQRSGEVVDATEDSAGVKQRAEPSVTREV